MWDNQRIIILKAGGRNAHTISGSRTPLPQLSHMLTYVQTGSITPCSHVYILLLCLFVSGINKTYIEYQLVSVLFNIIVIIRQLYCTVYRLCLYLVYVRQEQTYQKCLGCKVSLHITMFTGVIVLFCLMFIVLLLNSLYLIIYCIPVLCFITVKFTCIVLL